jgi:hypothetical protein
MLICSIIFVILTQKCSCPLSQTIANMYLVKPDSDLINKLVRRLIFPSGSKINSMENVTLVGFTVLYSLVI